MSSTFILYCYNKRTAIVGTFVGMVAVQARTAGFLLCVALLWQPIHAQVCDGGEPYGESPLCYEVRWDLARPQGPRHHMIRPIISWPKEFEGIGKIPACSPKQIGDSFARVMLLLEPKGGDLCADPALCRV